MPSGPPELHIKWQSDHRACMYLETRGFRLLHGFGWIAPRLILTAEEHEALDYLILEWDYGDIEAYALGANNDPRPNPKLLDALTSIFQGKNDG